MSELLARFFDRAADSRPAIVDGRGTHSYANVVCRAARIASHLRANGRRGESERIGILVAPGADFVSSLFGVLASGACVVVLSPIHPLPETKYFCEDAGVTTVIHSAEHAEIVSAATKREAILVDAIGPEAVANPDVARIEDGAPALQLYTSGTTGKPKGAVITHRNLAVQQALLRDAWGFSPADVLLHSLPLHHMHGLAIALLTALGAGATTRMIAFDAVRVWDGLDDTTVFMGVPSMYHRLFAAFDQADAATKRRWTEGARNLRLATSGSAALPVGLARRWEELTGRIPLERFGMTEVGVGLTNPLDGVRTAGCVGHPLPTVETRIVGDDGQDAEEGELWIRGPSVFTGYHRKEEETRKVFVDAPGDPNGRWFRTGDTVRRERDVPGEPFKIVGRTSVDILKSGGYKLSALEIEEVIREHPQVLEVAVVGIPDPAWGDRVVACVVPRPGAESAGLDAAALKAFVRGKLAPYKVPKDVLFVADLPKNPLGKVVKPELMRRISLEGR